ncbi:MAG TPA: hypothetical protein VEZ24_05955 [Microvirga sp.]|nr:hypothetical protein [Microvirga sp.]
MPPSEHILIDELSYRGAKVIASAMGPKTGYWLVWKGPRPERKALKAVIMSLMELEAALDEEPLSVSDEQPKAEDPKGLSPEGASAVSEAETPSLTSPLALDGRE